MEMFVGVNEYDTVRFRAGIHNGRLCEGVVFHNMRNRQLTVIVRRFWTEDGELVEIPASGMAEYRTLSRHTTKEFEVIAG